MGKLIDADALIMSMSGDADVFAKYCKRLLYDAPEAVVRCKDCRFYDTSEKDVFCKSLCKCKNLGSYMGENEFCSSGVRRK